MTLARGVLACIAAALLAACTAVHNGTGSALVIGQTEEPASLNPLLLQGAMSEIVDPLIFSSLLAVNDRGRLIPDLASQVPSLANGGISRDGLTVTYHLRNHVRWQDGAPLTASDVVFSYEQVMNPANDVPSRSGFNEVANVRALDARTVRVRLKRRYSPILSYFFGPDQNYPVLPKHVLAGNGNLNHSPFNTAPIGSGPYRVVRWKRGDELVLRANPLYFRGPPAISQIRMRFIPDTSTLLEQLRTGEVNVVFDADPAYLHQYETIPRLTVTRTPVNGTQGLLFNTADPVLRDVRVRRAIVQALDIPHIVRDATRGADTATNAGAGFFGWPYDPSIHAPAYDPARARSLLASAGAGHGLTVRFALMNGMPEMQAAALIIQQQLRQIGVGMTLRSYTPVQYAAPAQSGGPLFGGKFQLTLVQILSGIDPSTEYFFGCDQMPPRGFNLSRYCDSRLQAALDAGERTYDPRATRKYSEIVQARTASAVTFVPLWRRLSISVYPSWLHGVNPSPTTAYWNVWEWKP